MNKRSRIILAAGFISGGLAVMSGAFGAHAFHAILTGNGRIETYRTAELYHYIHTLALIATGILDHLIPSRSFLLPAVLFISGIILFSGSLYTLSLTGISTYGIITPFGGLCLIAAWILAAGNVIRKN